MSNPTTPEHEQSPAAEQVTELGQEAATQAAATEGQPTGGPSPAGATQSEMEQFRDRFLRAQAELENYRKRAMREKEDAIKFANNSLLEKLIPILDNFELGLQAAKNSPDGASIVIGFEMVARQLGDFLTQHGVEPIVAEGQKFDPNLHEAFMQEASDTVPEGVVIRQLRRGFKLRDRLLRPTAVVVSKGPEGA